MRLHRVTDIAPTALATHKYDLALFASGYETRATYVAAEVVNKDCARSVEVLGFAEAQEGVRRKTNDDFYRKVYGVEPAVCASGADGLIYRRLQGLTAGDDGPARILVDYSSMSRSWYAAVLNWARYQTAAREVVLDCVYSVGKHTTDDPPMVIDDILAIPGCEGGSVALHQSLAVFGLGFDALATLSVLDRLEPDVCFAYFAEPGGEEGYAERARSLNKELIEKHAGTQAFGLPLVSAERTFAFLAELVSPYLASWSVTLVPMGPKPHVLAAVLVAVRFPKIACLRVATKPAPSCDVRPTGSVVCSRIVFK